ncbi:hypothetical protein ABTL59_19845, partial [Acinetobacter baumannii]
ASLARSHARRERAGATRPRAAASGPARAGATRDLTDEFTWQLSLGRSRARRRAADLRFVPSSSRARKLSIGTLAALTIV